MLRRIALVSILVFCAADAARCEDRVRTTTLLAGKQLARFEIVMGRISISHARCGQCRVEASGEDDQSGEFLSVNAQGGNISLRYESADADGRLTVDFLSADDVDIQRTFDNHPSLKSVRYVQTAEGKVRLIVKHGDVEAEFTASELWQLMLAHGDECQEYLVPLLEELRPDWRLRENAEKIEAELLQIARTPPSANMDYITRLVDALGGDDFTRRQNAYRSLQALGQPALAHLRRIPPQTLSSEQRLRVRRLIAELTVRRGDTPKRAALWLAEVPAVWIAMMSHSDRDVRQLAAARLARMCDDDFQFDASATREARESQLADVRQRFGAD